MLSRSDLERLNWKAEEWQVVEDDGGPAYCIAGIVPREHEGKAALLAASPRLALACQSAVALAELIEEFEWPPDILEVARALGEEARQALAAAGCAAGAGDE